MFRVCNPIQVLVQEKETAQRIPGVQILGLRWEDTWRKVLECENGQVSTGTEENLVDEQGCFLMNVAGLYQFTAVAAGYDNLEQRLKLGSVETVDEFFDCSCSPESTLSLKMEIRQESVE